MSIVQSKYAMRIQIIILKAIGSIVGQYMRTWQIQLEK